jgi:hypothetical protein
MTTPILSDPTTNVAIDFTRLFSTLRASIVQQLFAVWFGMPGYRDADIDDWMGVALPLVQAGQETSAVATTTYMQLQLELLGIDSTLELPDMSLVTGGAIRNGVPPELVYARPFKEVWEALSNGYPFDYAVEQGANRLRQLVETDIQLSHTNTSRTLLSQRNDVVGFRRVPTGLYTCALCLVASTQRYNKLDLMPIHPGCDCRVAPIISEEPVSQVLDRDFLNEIHKSIEETFGYSARDARSLDYRKIMVVREHGEYGPLLAKAGNNFTKLAP